MNTLKITIVLATCLFIGVAANAQKNLAIETVFNDSGKQDGSILIELGKDVLGENTQITRYKSLIVTVDSETEKAIREAILKDTEGGAMLMESRRNGKVEKSYYCLKKDEKDSFYEYILFTAQGDKTTLIYIRGKFSPNRLQSEIENLKDLFIRINNKRVKLQ